MPQPDRLDATVVPYYYLALSYNDLLSMKRPRSSFTLGPKDDSELDHTTLNGAREGPEIRFTSVCNMLGILK